MDPFAVVVSKLHADHEPRQAGISEAPKKRCHLIAGARGSAAPRAWSHRAQDPACEDSWVARLQHNLVPSFERALF